MMPELYEVVGPSIFLKIINVFGGTNLEIPTHKDLKSAIRDVHIYNTLSKVPICDQHKYAARLGKHQDVGRDPLRPAQRRALPRPDAHHRPEGFHTHLP
jgi:hypothetical protein